MANLTYNGIPIGVFTCTREIAAEVVRESDLDLIGSRYTFHVTGVINPAAFAYRQDVGNAPVVSPGETAATTLAAIRDALSQTGRTLTYTWNGQTVFQSPATNPKTGNPYPCDVTGGPRPLRQPEIISVSGDKTMLVRFSISTVMNESYKNTSTIPVLLSNRWSVEDQYDECAFRTLVYRGRAVFRADALNTLTVNGGAAVPDDFRDWVANFTIPPGFQREDVWVKQDAEGFGLNYQVVDVQQPVTLTDRRAMKVEAVQFTGVNSKGGETGFLDNFFAVGDQFGGMIGTLIGGFMGHGFGNLGTPGSMNGIDLFAPEKRLLDNLPRATDRIIITVKGHPGSTRKDLTKVAYAVLGARIGVMDRAFGNTRAMLAQDLMGKWVRLEVDLDRGAIQTVVEAVAGNGAFTVAGLADTVPDDDGIADVTQSAPGTNPPFPNGSGLRGTSLEQLVRAALLNPYTVPAKPPAPRLAGAGLAPQQ